MVTAKNDCSYDVMLSQFIYQNKFGFFQVIDMLLFKAMEELNNVTEHAKQRHHLIGQYVVGHKGLVNETHEKDKGSSEFLKQFYAGNYV